MKESALVKPGITDTMVLGKFTLTSGGLQVAGEPTLEEYERVGHFIDWTLESAAWWKADWLAYGETRADWKERLDQAVAMTGLAQKTLLNMKSVAEQVPPSRRRVDVSFGVHAAVAPLSAKDQTHMLARAAEEGLGVREVKVLIRAARRRAVLEGQAKLEGFYRVWYVDPAWEYGNAANVTGAEDHYPTMPVEEMMALPVKAHTHKDAVMLMWATAPVLLQNPGPRDLGEAWGFEYKTNVVWDKVRGNFGNYCHPRHEHLLIWTRGSGTPDVDPNWFDSVQTFRSTEHSAKPIEFYNIIEKLWTSGPYVELFARAKRKGWSAFGNDARLWAPGEGGK